MKRRRRTGRPNDEARVRLEPFVFLGIILLVWFVGAFGSWLRREIERQSAIPPDADVTAGHAADSTLTLTSTSPPPLPDGVAVTPDAAAHDARGIPGAVPRVVPMGRPRAVSGRLRAHGPRAARDGIIMLTVFGACKALEPWSRKT